MSVSRAFMQVPDALWQRRFWTQCRKEKEAQVVTLGRSWLGREILGLQLGKPRGAVVLAGCFHATEWLTALILFRFAAQLVTCQREEKSLCKVDIRRVLQKRGVLIVPVVNPDGLELHLHGESAAGSFRESVRQISPEGFHYWNANIRGVDLNHNFDAGWQQLHRLERSMGITGPAPRRYGGERPASEPETTAMVRTCLQQDVSRVYAFHSQGEEIYYHYGENTPPEARSMAQMLAQSSGYHLAHPEGTASFGGFKDWFIETMHRPGFTVEIGRGENPLPLQDLPAICARLEEMLALTLVL